MASFRHWRASDWRAGAAMLGLFGLVAQSATAQEAVPAATTGEPAEAVGYRIDVTGSDGEPFYARCRVVDKDGHFRIQRFRGAIPRSVEFPVEAVDCKVTVLDASQTMAAAVVELRSDGEEVLLGKERNPYFEHSVIVRSAGYWGSAGAAPWWPEWAHEFPPE